MKKIEFFLFAIILLGAFCVRLYRIDNPIADWHSWRQVDTAAVTRNFVEEGIDLLHPRFNDISNIASGFDNPQGYRFVEFPILNATTAVAYKLAPIFPLEVWGRLVTIIGSLFSLTFLYLLVRKYGNTRIALFTAAFFAFLPYNIYYSRVILPDPAMVMASLGSIYFFDRWLSSFVILRTKSEESRRGSFVSLRMTALFLLAVIFTACALLLKPYALFFMIPMIYLSYRKWGMKVIIQPQLWLFVILVLALTF
jgi:hypothetical protein